MENWPFGVCGIQLSGGNLKGKKKNLNHKTISTVCIFTYTGYTQKNGAVSKVNNKFISHLIRAQRTPSAAATVQVSHALPEVRFSCLLRGRGASFQDGVAAGKGFLCDPFWGVQICDYSAAHGLGKTHRSWCFFSKSLPYLSNDIYSAHAKSICTRY